MRWLLPVFVLVASIAAGQKVTDPWVEQTLKQMSVDEKIGQLITIASPNPNVFTNIDSELFDSIKGDISKFKPGGVAVFAGDVAAVAMLVNRMQEVSKVPLLMAADMEPGIVYRFTGTTRFPSPMAIGATGDEKLAYAIARVTAVEGRSMGIHLNYAPVADVNNNPENPVISVRSFGEDVAAVEKMVVAYVRGLEENGMLATAKHFPGHGDTQKDSHLELPTIDATRERLDAIELVPFRAAVRAGVSAIMTAHLLIPALDPSRTPATLSRPILTDLLRKELGFDGLIYTDAMNMRAVLDNFPLDRASVMAFRAGADIITTPIDVEAAYNGLKNAVSNREISVEEIDARVRRILHAKARAGLNKNRYTDVRQLDTIVGRREHQSLALEAQQRAVTLVKDEAELLPIRPDFSEPILHVTMVDNFIGFRDVLPGDRTLAELGKRYGRVTNIHVTDLSSPGEFDVIRKTASQYAKIFVTCYLRVASAKGTVSLTPLQVNFLRDISRTNRNAIVTVYGSPYLLMAAPEIPTYLVTYDSSPLAETAAIKAIFGEAPVTGRLPVSFPGMFPIGHGIQK